MTDLSKEIKEKIRKKIEYSSQRTENLVIRKFNELGYIAHHHYYEDYDSQKQTSVLRELDFNSYKSYNHKLKSGKTIKITIQFIGDVKFHLNYGSRIAVGLDALPIEKEFSDVAALSTLQEILSFLNLFSDSSLFYKILNNIESFVTDNKSSDSQKKVDTEFNMSTSSQIFFFDEKGDESDKSKDLSHVKFRNYCNQVFSGYDSIKKKSESDLEELDLKNSEINNIGLLIPTLIFGNSMKFFISSKNLKQENFMKPVNYILYLFQPVKRTEYSFGNLTPIFITSYQNLQKQVSLFEKALGRNLTF